MTTSARHLVPFQETMTRLHGEIERLVYAAEINCPNKEHKDVYKCERKNGCPFYRKYCTLICLRGDIGDHVQQDDIP